MSDLSSHHCVPCEGGIPPLKGEKLVEYKIKLDSEAPDWKIIDEHHLLKKFPFKNFRQVLEFVNKVGEIAEKEGHHPDIKFGWGFAEITTFTHSIGGLSENDFILASKIDVKNSA